MKTFKEKDGFTPIEISFPIPFDLVILVDQKGKTRNGWWTGQTWDGLNIDIYPIAWKKIGQQSYNNAYKE